MKTTLLSIFLSMVALGSVENGIAKSILWGVVFVEFLVLLGFWYRKVGEYEGR